MNQLTSLFKRSLFSEKLARTTFIAGASFAAIIFYGCQNLLQPTKTASPEEQRVRYSAAVKVYIRNSQKTASLYVGEFDRSSCEKGFPEQWSMFFSSPFGQHRFDLDYTAVIRGQADTIAAKTVPQRYHLKIGTLPPALLEQKLCDEASGEEAVTIESGTPAAEAVLQPLQILAPDCTFDLSGEANLQCRMAVSGPEALMQKFDGLKRNMTTKWNHQPYLLIRRLTLATQMLEALRAPAGAQELKKVCRIIQYSLPHELPLSFRSKIWQDKVCNGQTPQLDIAYISLEHASKELEALSKRIEDASLIGLFTLAVPREQSPHREYWISLQPVDVPYVTSEQPPQTTHCAWHPLYFEQVDHQLVATDLGQLSLSDRSFCTPIPTLGRAKRDADIYIRSSMASEMEFQIANGQSKQLRLPTGDYKYSITQFSGPFPEEAFSAQEIGRAHV